MTRFGPYELVRQIAVGGMAELHLARTEGIAGFEKYVAIKMIHPNFAEDSQFVSMLIDEAKIAVQLQHANIGQTFDLGRVGDRYYITMEYIDGADVYRMLRASSERNEDMPMDLCAYVAKEMASGLDYAHRKKDREGRRLGIVHRDISPQNVLVSYAGEVKIVDFGIAKAVVKLQQTAAGIIKGKYYYMSPEQAHGQPIDARSDIFSAGIVLYEMLVGQMLYMEEHFDRLLQKVRAANIPPPSTIRAEIPPALDDIVMRALARVPGERYQTAGELASALEQYLHRSVPQFSTSFTASRLAQFVRDVMGDPEPVTIDQPAPLPGDRSLALNANQVAHDRDELHDENSMLFRLSELAPQPPSIPPLAPRKDRVTKPVVEAVAPAPAPQTVAARKPVSKAPPPLPPSSGTADVDATLITNDVPRQGPADATLLGGANDFSGIDATTVDAYGGASDRTLVDEPAPSGRPASAAVALAASSPTAIANDRRSVRASRNTPPPGSLLQNLVSIRGTAPVPGQTVELQGGDDTSEPSLIEVPIASPTAQTIQPAEASGIRSVPWLFPETPTPRSNAFVYGMVFAVALFVGIGVTLLLLPRRVAVQATLLIDSMPAGALAFVDNVQLPHPTPVPFSVKPGRYNVKVVLPRHEPYQETVLVTEASGEIRVTAVLRSKKGKLVISAQPAGTEIYINGERRGTAPNTLDVDMSATKEVELRSGNLPRRVVPLEWPENGTLSIDVNLAK